MSYPVSVQLLIDSNVLADANASCQEEKRNLLKLFGKDQTANVLRAFLKVIISDEIDIMSELPVVAELCLFCKKWGCTDSTICILRNVVLCALWGKLSVLGVFTLAATIDHVELATAVLQFASRYDPYQGNPLDPRGWDINIWRAIDNSDYLFALSRAYEEVGPTENLSEKFWEYLIAAKAASHEAGSTGALAWFGFPVPPFVTSL